jgi:hypothetical protein
MSNLILERVLLFEECLRKVFVSCKLPKQMFFCLLCSHRKGVCVISSQTVSVLHLNNKNFSFPGIFIESLTFMSSLRSFCSEPIRARISNLEKS